MQFQTYTFSMSGKSKTIQYVKMVGLFNKQTITLTVPDVELTQQIQNVFKISVVIEPGMVTIVDGIQQLYDQVVRDFDVITYVDPSNNRNMNMIFNGKIFIGYFSLPIEGEDAWSQLLLNELIEKGMMVTEVPKNFEGLIA